MIHYHGGPVTPVNAAVELWSRRHACVSFAHPGQVALAAEVCQSFILDNGAFTAWKQGGAVNVREYAEWVREWDRHPGYDWCLIPDVIDGTEHDNDLAIAEWRSVYGSFDGCVPVWHLHESLDRLRYLAKAYPRIALGSSGVFATPNTASWWARMAEAMAAVCDGRGRPRTRLHGLRMLNPDVFRHLPLSSADSTNVAQNIGIDRAWRGTYQPVTEKMRALVIAERTEMAPTAAVWQVAPTTQLELINA